MEDTNLSPTKKKKVQQIHPQSKTGIFCSTLLSEIRHSFYFAGEQSRLPVCSNQNNNKEIFDAATFFVTDLIYSSNSQQPPSTARQQFHFRVTPQGDII